MLNQLFVRDVVKEKIPPNGFEVIEIDAADLKISQERTKLWELDHNYHCAVIGTCLTLEEVTKLLRSFQIDIRGGNSYDIHTTIVTIISHNDYRSRKVQSFLNKKFKEAIQKTKKMKVDELVQEWKRVVNSGELIATFWAVISHPRTNRQMKRDFYGDIHMQSHMSGSSNRVDLKRLNKLENESKKVTQLIRVRDDKYKKAQEENITLYKKLSQQDEVIFDFSNKISALKNANEQLSIINNSEKNQQLNAQLKKLMHTKLSQEVELNNLENNQTHLNKVVTDLKRKIKLDRKEITEYKKEIEHLQFVLTKNKESDKCVFKKQGLCGQCVLYVGGKASLIPYYRELVEANSGVFLHHDGGVEKSTQNLSQSLNRADLVIFPSDCISHIAYWKIKTTCKKQQKPYEYLKSPGLHSLSSVLDKIIVKSELLEEVF